MAKKRKPKKENEEQSRRFVETARDLGADQSDTLFGRIIGKLVPTKPSKKRQN